MQHDIWTILAVWTIPLTIELSVVAFFVWTARDKK